MGFNPLSILKSIAPMLISALPFGGIVGNIAKDVINKQFGSDHKTPEDAIKALQNPTADDIVKIKQAEADIVIRLKELGINEVRDLAALENADRDSARNREIQVRDHIPAILAIVTTIALYAVIIYLANHDIPEKNHDIILVLITALTTGWIAMMGYYFGSSIGSKKAGEALAAIAKNGN